MSGRAAKWGGGALAAVAVIGLGVYLTAAGLDKADKLASVIGVFIGLAGLATAVYGTVRDRRADPPPLPSAVKGTHEAVHNEISGGIYHGPVIQGHDFGQITLGSPPQPAPPPGRPDLPAEE